MYVVATEACSVQNSAAPVPVSVVAAQRARVASVMTAWDTAQRGFTELVNGRSPSEFTGQGLPVQVEVSRRDHVPAGDVSAGGSGGRGRSPACGCRLAGPEFVPMSAASSVRRPVAVLTTDQGPTPPAAIVPAAVHAAPVATVRPRYLNLCWGLRHGMVDQSQFDPSEYAALQMRCSQLGYAGACPPPREIAAYLAAGRQAGSLPHISVNDSDLAALAPVPPGVQTLGTCAESAAMGGVGLGRLRAGLGDFRCAAPVAVAAPVVALGSAAPGDVLTWAKTNPGTAGGIVAALVAIAVSGLRVRGGL